MLLSEIITSVFKVYKESAKPINLQDINCYENLGYRYSGCVGLDWILANHSAKGGLPRGRIIEIFSPEGAGKTTLAIIAAASIQKYKHRNKAVIIDYENKLNIPYAISLGLDVEKTVLLQPSGKFAGESGLEFMIQAANADDVGIVIVDSISAVVAKEELDGELTDAAMCSGARLWSKAIKKLNENLTSESATIILINQLRDNIGAVWGSTEKTAGARSIKFACAARIDLRAKEKIEDRTGSIVGQTIKLKAVKNQIGRPFQEAMIDLYYGEGYDNVKWLINTADELKLLRTAAADKANGLKSGVYVHFDEKEERFTRVQLTEKLENKKAFNQLLSLCIERNTQILAEASAERKRNKSKEQQSEEPPDF